MKNDTVLFIVCLIVLAAFIACAVLALTHVTKGGLL